MRARPSKYNARVTIIDGIRFHSKAEAKRYGELKLLERAGQIYGLVLQPKYPVTVGEQRVMTYIGDFRYFDEEGIEHIEDVKGCDTALSRLKRKLVEATYPGVTIALVKVRG